MTQKLSPSWGFPGAPRAAEGERCEICGGLWVCPGPPPENQVSEDEGLEFRLSPWPEGPVDPGPPPGWCGGHATKAGRHYHRDRPGYGHIHVGSGAADRMRKHGWPYRPLWVAQIDYVVVYKKDEQ